MFELELLNRLCAIADSTTDVVTKGEIDKLINDRWGAKERKD